MVTGGRPKTERLKNWKNEKTGKKKKHFEIDCVTTPPSISQQLFFFSFFQFLQFFQFFSVFGPEFLENDRSFIYK